MQAPNANMPPDQASPAEGPSLDAAEADQIKRFESDQRRPVGVKDVIDNMADDRKYVHTDANLPDTPGGVATNYLARYQWIHSSQIYAKDPSVSVRQKRKLGSRLPPIQQLLDDYGKTVEYIVQHCATDAGLRPIVDGMIQDVDSAGIVFLKVNFLEDLGRDPTGTFRPHDLSSQVRRLTRLRDDFANGKFLQTDAQYADMAELAQCVQKEMEAEHWRQAAYPSKRQVIGPDGQPTMDKAGLPILDDVPYPPNEDPRRMRWDGLPTPPQITEIPKYRGFVLDVFDAEDVCWDYNITRPEMLHRGDHLDTRVWMSAAKIREDYSISQDDSQDYIPSNSAGEARSRDTEDTTNKRADTDADERMGLLAVWERQCADGYVYTWVKGAAKFLRKVKRDITTSSRFNVFALYFNRVSGRVLPISNVTLGRSLQDEINTVRTHKRQAKRAAYNRYVANKDLFTDAEKEKLENCPPEGVVFVNKPVEDIRKGLFQINGQFNEAVHDVGEEKQELSIAMNVPQAATGQTKGGADTATEAAIANQSSDAMAGRHRFILESFLQQVFTYMAEVVIQALPEDNAKSIAGPGAVWPMVDREALWSHLEVDIEAGSTGKPDQKQRMDAFHQAMETGQLMGIGVNPAAPTWNYPKVLEKLADIMDWREDADSLISMPPLPRVAPTPFPNGAPGALPMGPNAGPGPGPGGPPMLPHPPAPPGPPQDHAHLAPQMHDPNHMAGAGAPR